MRLTTLRLTCVFSIHHLMDFYRLMQIQQLFMKYLFVSLRFATLDFDVTVDGFPKNDLKTQTIKVLFRWSMNHHLQYLFNSNMKKNSYKIERCAIFYDGYVNIFIKNIFLVRTNFIFV